MSLAICHHLAHMINILLFIFASVLLWVLLQNSDDFATRVVADGFAGAVILGPTGVLEAVHAMIFAISTLPSRQSLPAGSLGFFAAEPVL
jgi:hypothetical protein